MGSDHSRFDVRVEFSKRFCSFLVMFVFSVVSPIALAQNGFSRSLSGPIVPNDGLSIMKGSSLGAITGEGTDSKDVSSPQRVMSEITNNASLRIRSIDNRVNLDPSGRSLQKDVMTKPRRLARGESTCNGPDEVSSLRQRLRGKQPQNAEIDASVTEIFASNALANKPGCRLPSSDAAARESRLGVGESLQSRWPQPPISTAGQVVRPTLPRPGAGRTPRPKPGTIFSTLEVVKKTPQSWGSGSGPWRGWEPWGGWAKRRSDQDREEIGPLPQNTTESSLGRDDADESGAGFLPDDSGGSADIKPQDTSH